jgi:predicted dehydrogenase
MNPGISELPLISERENLGATMRACIASWRARSSLGLPSRSGSSGGRRQGISDLGASSLREVPELADAVSVAVPTVAHAEVGCQLLRSGLDVLVEKPMAVSLREADALLETARRHKRIFQVGHLERFNPAVVAVAPILNRPLFFQMHRLGVFTPRSLDVEVVYDLMIHDLDILLALVKEPVTELKTVGIPVLTDKVDIAHVRLEFAGGAVANVTASRFRPNACVR